MGGEMQETIGVGVNGQAPTPQKFARYRSVRRAGSQRVEGPKAETPAVPVLPISSKTISSQNSTDPANQQGSTIARSMSRYRRQRNAGPSTTSQPPVPTPVHQFHASRVKQNGDFNGISSHGMTRNAKEATEREKASGARGTDESRGKSGGSEDESDTARVRHRQDAMSRLMGGNNIVTSKPTRESTRGSTRTRKHTEDKRNGVSTNRQEGPMKQDEEGHVNGQIFSKESKLRSLKSTMKLSRSKNDTNEPAPSKPTEPSGGVFPGIDAPISAVNAGERKVLVQYRLSSTYLPVTPSTRVQDLLYSAQKSFAAEIDSQKFIMMESFTQLALERPLRRYEYIRDVLNSWSYDEENVLIIVPPASLDALHQLDVQGVPAEQPGDMTFHIYHSQRHRKWDKRYVTLRSDGQVTTSKKYQAQDQTNICHLSDFDIYSPTASSLSNNVKPPKKICYAVKSQQKASMFLSTENYVHFFSTNDRAIAQGLYKALQSWRSWYLVDALGAGQNEDEGESLPNVSRQVSGESSGSKPYQPKPLKPLLELSTLDQNHDDGEVQPSSSMERGKSLKTRQLFFQKKNSRDFAPPLPAYPKSLTVDTNMEGSTTQGTEGSPFSSNGLLGHTYTVRQRAMQEQEENKRIFEEAFNGQGLVSNASPCRQVTGPRSQPSSRSNTMTAADKPDVNELVKRSQSVGQGKNKPLVDLTPVYQEPPQHIRKGRGVTVEPGIPLIDAATGREHALGAVAIPPATTWKRPPIPEEHLSSSSSNDNGQIRSRSNTVRSSRYNRQNHTAPSSPTSAPNQPAPSDGPFIPNSLLARSANLCAVQSGQPTGHGLATGDRNATKPMLDLSPENPFGEGSLLRDR